ncbi:MAG: DUF4097 domain-containing protein [Acidobacteria bacterium]|nr:DUF4097 domain-containing protein [Acidobacteriota bacterium]
MRVHRSILVLAGVLAGLMAASALDAGAETKIEKEFPLAAGGAFVLQTDGGPVAVKGSDRATARIVITSRAEDVESLYDFKYETTPQLVKLVVKRKGSGVGSWFSWGRNDGLAFEVELPRGARCDVGTAGGPIAVSDMQAGVQADTSGGPIDLHRIRGPVSADTSGGPISIEDVDGSVNADTSGGPIRISKVTGDISADTSGGGIDIAEAGGQVTADTSGGPIAVRFASGNSKGGSLESSGGGITIAVDPAAKLTLDAESSGGSVSCDLPVTVVGERDRSELRGELNGGGAVLRARTSGGGIRISAR